MKKIDTLPTVMDYSNFLNQIQTHKNISRDEARTMYGQFTYTEWYELLKNYYERIK